MLKGSQASAAAGGATTAPSLLLLLLLLGCCTGSATRQLPLQQIPTATAAATAAAATAAATGKAAGSAASGAFLLSRPRAFWGPYDRNCSSSRPTCSSSNSSSSKNSSRSSSSFLFSSSPGCPHGYIASDVAGAPTRGPVCRVGTGGEAEVSVFPGGVAVAEDIAAAAAAAAPAAAALLPTAAWAATVPCFPYKAAAAGPGLDTPAAVLQQQQQQQQQQQGQQQEQNQQQPSRWVSLFQGLRVGAAAFGCVFVSRMKQRILFSVSLLLLRSVGGLLCHAAAGAPHLLRCAAANPAAAAAVAAAATAVGAAAAARRLLRRRREKQQETAAAAAAAAAAATAAMAAAATVSAEKAGSPPVGAPLAALLPGTGIPGSLLRSLGGLATVGMWWAPRAPPSPSGAPKGPPRNAALRLKAEERLGLRLAAAAAASFALWRLLAYYR